MGDIRYFDITAGLDLGEAEEYLHFGLLRLWRLLLRLEVGMEAI
jgi:hypothetical protein